MTVRAARAVVHGAVSIVNALATGKGATLGIGLVVEASVRARSGGTGITILNRNNSLSTRLVRQTVQHVVPKHILSDHTLEIDATSEMPAGFGLKSSSAISSAVALACAHMFKHRLSDHQIILAGVRASLAARVSITGAYDDACSCYYGGFNVTDNTRMRRLRNQAAPDDMSTIIFIPKNRRRGDLKRLGLLSPIFDAAWDHARRAEYWKAMTINGLAVSELLGYKPGLVGRLMEAGAVAASVSGNGPAVAAIVGSGEDERSVRRVFSKMDGRIVTSRINNQKAEVYDL